MAICTWLVQSLIQLLHIVVSYYLLLQRQVVTETNGIYAHWPTLINWLLVYNDEEMNQVTICYI